MIIWVQGHNRFVSILRLDELSMTFFGAYALSKRVAIKAAMSGTRCDDRVKNNALYRVRTRSSIEK